jgi:acyl-CoA thioesterase-1
MRSRLLLLLCASLAFAQQKQPNPAFAAIEDVAGLPRVLIIGDSISIGYTLPVREMLQGKANVHRIPANAATTRVTLGHIDEWLGDGKWDVIHCNWGLHDLKIMDDGKHQVPLEDYEKNLEELVARLEKTGAKLIYATTTPVPEGKVNPPRHPADVPRYNAVAMRVMKRHHIPVDNLYQAILPKLATLQQPVNVHYTPEGYSFLARHVADSILAALNR